MSVGVLKSRLCILAVLLCASRASGGESLVKNVAEFDAAVKAAQPGDEIILADGQWLDADLRFSCAGTNAQPINLRAQTPGKVLMLGASRLRIGGKHLKASGLYWKLPTAKDDVISFRIDSKTLAESCELFDCAIVDDSPDGGERKWVSLYGHNHTVHHCRFDGKKSPGTLLVVWLDDSPPHHKITLNFFGPRSALGKNGGEIIRIGDSKTSLQEANTEVSSNYFYRCSGEAEIISNKSCGNLYTANSFVGCGGALTLRHGNRCRVEGNTFFGDHIQAAGGVRIIGEQHVVIANLFYQLGGKDTRAALSIMNGIPNSPANGYVQVREASITGNFFVDCREPISLGLRDEDEPNQTLPPVDCQIVGNFVTGRGGAMFNVRTPAPSTTYSGNSFAGAKLGFDDTTGWTEVNLEELKQVIEQQDRIKPAVFPQEVGPHWLKPEERFLPESMKQAARTKPTSD